MMSPLFWRAAESEIPPNAGECVTRLVGDCYGPASIILCYVMGTLASSQDMLAIMMIYDTVEILA